jgi:sulfonate transport system permease protein
MNVKLLTIKPTANWPLAGVVTAAAARRLRRALLPFALPAVVLLVWQVTAAQEWLPVQILPSPGLVLATLGELLRGGDIASALAISLWRIALGFAIGASCGMLLGALIGVSATLNDYLGPTFKALAQIPSLGWLPILILVFGLDETLKLVIIAKASFVPTVFATSQAIRNVPQQYLEAGRVLRLRRRTWLTKLLIPATLPTVFGGLRMALSSAWIALIVVEMLAATEGVGYMMVWGRTLFQIDIVIVGMLVIGALGFAMDTGLSRIERSLRRWEPRHG